MPSNFTNNTFSSSSIEVDPSIPLVSTGSSETRQRSRSLSVDYITQSNSVIKRKSSTVITVISLLLFSSLFKCLLFSYIEYVNYTYSSFYSCIR